MLKLAVVTPIPTPYRDGFWNMLAARDDVDLAVYYCAGGKSDRPWRGEWPREYRWEVLPGCNLLGWRGAGSSLYYNPAILTRLATEVPDAVLVGGYNHATMLITMRHCRRHGIPYFVMCESHLLRPRGRVRRLAKDRLVRRVVRNMAGGLPTGILAEEYLLHYGAVPNALAHLPNVPDIQRIGEEVARLRVDRSGLRRELGLPEQAPVALFAGRLVPQKGAQRLLKALALLRDSQPLHLVIAGDGPQRAALQRQAEQAGLADRVHFAGFIEPQELLRWYAAADVFVLPSQETWGVVVVEALAAGLPVVVSEGVGCHPDLVTDPALGRVVRSPSPEALAQALREVLLMGCDSAQFKEAWRPLACRLRYEAQADQLMGHLRARVMGRKAA